MTRAVDASLNRRQFLGAAALAGAGALTLANTQCEPAIVRRLQQFADGAPTRHGAWVWQFSIDGPAERMAETLAENNLGVVVKTHDGLDWMSRFDPVPGAINGPQEVSIMARIFERFGVPFHAWCVVKGIEPVREARMAADVLAAGARSLTLDVEPYDGFWSGSNDDARRFGEELRSRDPNGRVDISIDPRPWVMLHSPIRQFVEFTDGIRPQLYWDAFDTTDNLNAYRYMGYDAPDGMTADFLLTTSHEILAHYDRWIVPIVHAAPKGGIAWPEFAHAAWELQMYEIDVWRYGLMSETTVGYLGANPPGEEPALSW